MPHDLVGRSADVAALHRLVEAGRAVTLIGPGGVGKTRLALEFAARFGQDGQRVGVVELAAVTGSDRVAQAVSTSLELRSGPHDSAAAMIAEWSQAKPALIVLDNCEHLGDVPASIVFEVLSCSANVAVLATSRNRCAFPASSSTT